MAPILTSASFANIAAHLPIMLTDGNAACGVGMVRPPFHRSTIEARYGKSHDHLDPARFDSRHRLFLRDEKELADDDGKNGRA